MTPQEATKILIIHSIKLKVQVAKACGVSTKQAEVRLTREGFKVDVDFVTEPDEAFRAAMNMEVKSLIAEANKEILKQIDGAK